MESDSVDISGSGSGPGVAEAWETVTAALVSGVYHRSRGAK